MEDWIIAKVTAMLCDTTEVHRLNQELMSGEATKERATAAYVRVPSKSKLLASELPNMETCSSI